MIKILIIEDNEEKLKRITSFLEDECNLKADDLDCAPNVRVGRECLTNDYYDLLLLDLIVVYVCLIGFFLNFNGAISA